MGGQNSKQTHYHSNESTSASNNIFNSEEFYNKIDDIATNYILTMDFKSLKKLSEKEYCHKLVLLTSDIFEEQLNSREIKYLLQRTQFGANEDENAEYLNEMKQKKFFFYMNNETKKFDKFDVTLNDDNMNDTEKSRVCIGIAKFYIIIAHLFASIVKTINPIYTYSDSNGNNIEVDFFNKDRIPNDAKATIKKLSLCDNRLRALKENIQADENNNIYFKSHNCDINIEKETLNNEPGIYEFQNLYLDDNYDYLTGNFTSKSEASIEIFNDDLKRFYTEFTGNDTMPSDIKTFSDIKLKYFKKEECVNNDDPIYENDENSDLFTLYAKNIRTMMQNTSFGQGKLLEILNLIFIPKDETKFILNPELTEDLLYALVSETRKIIMNLYLSCEKDYVNGIKIYTDLINRIKYQTTQRQIEYLENQQKKLICKYIPLQNNSEIKKDTNINNENDKNDENNEIDQNDKNDKMK